MTPWEIIKLIDADRAAWEDGHLRDDDGTIHRDGEAGEPDFALCGPIGGAFPATDAVDCPDCLAVSGEDRER